jgi:hypothetical protein
MDFDFVPAAFHIRRPKLAITQPGAILASDEEITAVKP